MSDPNTRIASSTWAAALWFLLALFLLRVTAQLVQLIFPIALLPPFDDWDSGLVPYGFLLTVQVAIAATMARLALRVGRSSVAASARSARIWVSLGLVYFAVMSGRLILGLTALSDVAWFTNRLSTTFHFVLAAFVLLIGLFHRQMHAETRQPV